MCYVRNQGLCVYMPPCSFWLSCKVYRPHGFSEVIPMESSNLVTNDVSILETKVIKFTSEFFFI